jgi:hypothetical protein
MDPWVSAYIGLDNLAGVILTVSVDDEDFEFIMRVIIGDDGIETLSYISLFVSTGDNSRQLGPLKWWGRRIGKAVGLQNQLISDRWLNA